MGFDPRSEPIPKPANKLIRLGTSKAVTFAFKIATSGKITQTLEHAKSRKKIGEVPL